MDAVDPLRARLAEAWPLFGLELRSERLRLRLPTDPELLEVMAVARAGIHPPDEMPFASAWSTQESPGFERGYLAYHWTNRAAWTPEAWEIGLLVTTHAGQVLGMQGVDARDFAHLRTVATGSWLSQAVQRQGYGREMRAAVLGFAFDGLGALGDPERQCQLRPLAAREPARLLRRVDPGEPRVRARLPRVPLDQPGGLDA